MADGAGEMVQVVPCATKGGNLLRNGIRRGWTINTPRVGSEGSFTQKGERSGSKRSIYSLRRMEGILLLQSLPVKLKLIAPVVTRLQSISDRFTLIS
jgi:hypothetical protein